MEVIHRHLIVRAETKKTPTDRAWTHGWLQQLVGKIGMKICEGRITSYSDIKSISCIQKVKNQHVLN